MEFLKDELPGLLEDIQMSARMWYMHHVATAHFSRVDCQHLDKNFHDRWIGRGGPAEWPARSPVMNALDLYRVI